MDRPKELPPVPEDSKLEWLSRMSDNERERQRKMHVEGLKPIVGAVVLEYFPGLNIDDPELFDAFVERQANGLRNYFEEGVQSGIDTERSAMQSHLIFNNLALRR